jgi:hypothetical protein
MNEAAKEQRIAPKTRGVVGWTNPRHWRKATWVLHAWNVFFLIVIARTIADRTSGCQKGDQICGQLSTVGAAIAVVFFILLWFLGLLVLLFGWFKTRTPRAQDHRG